ncbi:hypothetical protein SAMN04487761_10285 [Lachnospiraceae bacterium C7]|nr:hypothetical protein SAMN04487761_10285 [Lachnospiraceae bacterium C7]
MKYYVLSRSNYGIISNYMLSDLQKLENVEFVYEKDESNISNNRYIRKIQRIIKQINYKIVRKNKLIKSIINDSYDSDNVKILIATNEALQEIEVSDLEYLRKNGIKVVLLMIDPMSAKYPSVSVAKEMIKNFKFDKIISFDPKDSKEYGYLYSNTLYSKFDVKNNNIDTDLYYVGNVKNRFEFLDFLKQEAKNNNVKPLIKLLGLNAEQKSELSQDEIIQSYMPYDAMVEDLQRTKCILDITQSGQSGITLRYYEAVVYNKKLLTNNPNIKELPFYDERYMKIYKDIKDIDWDWIKNDEMPEYNYNGEFSPINLLD